MRFIKKQLKTLANAIAIMTLPAVIPANPCLECIDILEEESADSTKEFTLDGPYVFYKKGLVLVRSIERQDDGSLTVQKEVFDSKDDIPFLTCKVDDASKAIFKVKLHSDYSVPPSSYPQPEKLFAISDIEGNFYTFVTTLQGNGIINEKFEWTFGEGHLVLVGDFFDRGTNVTEVLWLIYELERQAEAKGGMVHFIIGNHEEMNLRGDTRYVNEKYFKVAAEFKLQYTSLYANNTELGKWLRSKNVIEKIGNTIYVHGGLSPQLANCHTSLNDINKIARTNYGKAGWQVEKDGGMAERIYSMVGPMWYRGYFDGNMEAHEIIRVLNLYGAEAVVVGHTIVPNVSGIFNNKVIAIDVKHCTAIEDGSANALLFENGKYLAVNANGHKSPVYPMLTENEVLRVFTAIRENKPQVINQFLINGNNINKYYSSKQYTLLHYAIKNNQPEVVDFLLKKGAKIEQPYEGLTPLMYAIKLQNIEIVNLLLKNGANVNTLNEEQESALIYCAKYGNVEMVKFLIDNGAITNIKDVKGRTAIDYALKHDNNAVADYLKEL